MEDRSNFKYKIQVELGGEQQKIVGYKIEDGHLVVGGAWEGDAPYIDNVRLVFNGKYYNRCLSINNPHTSGWIVPIALEFPFTSFNWDFSGDIKYFYTNDNLTLYLEDSYESATIEDLLAEYTFPTIDTTLYKYRFPCIGLITDGIIERLAINIKGIFYPYSLYDANLLHLYDHTLGEDESFNKVGYYYSNDLLLLQITDLAVEYYTTDDFYLNPDYLNKQIQLNTSLIIQYQNEITELEKLVELLKSQLGVDVTPGYNDPVKDGLFIDIFRISPDGKYLEIDITCDETYKFERFFIYDYKNKLAGYEKDILKLLGEEFNSSNSRILARISLDKLFGNTMYYANIEIELKEGYSAEEIIDSNKLYEVATSDVSNVYFYLLPGLIQLGHPCDPCDLEIPIEIQRAFLIMWSHIEAMRLERWKEAEMFYTLIKNNFLNCLAEFEVKQKPCNCHALKLSNFNYSRRKIYK